MRLRLSAVLAPVGLATVITIAAFVGNPLGSDARTTPAPAPVASSELTASVGAPGDSGLAITDADIARQQQQVRAHPQDQNALDALGATYLQRMRDTYDFSYLTRARQVFEVALRKHPHDFYALVGMGSLAGTQHRFAEELSWARRAAAVSEQSSTVEGLIADADTELGDYHDAFIAYQRMVDDRPDISSYSRASRARFLVGDSSGAVAAMEMAVDAGGPVAENTEWSRVQLGQLYFKEGHLLAARREFARALADYPGYHRALAGLAQVAAAQHHYAAAERYLTDAVNRVPAPDYLVLLGDIYTVDHKPVLAGNEYELVGVEQRLFKANGGRPDLELALFNANHGQPALAVREARVAITYRPSTLADETLGWSLARAGHCAEGVHYSELSLRLGTKEPLTLYHAAAVEACAGHRARARADLALALRLNPQFAPLEAAHAAVLAHRLGLEVPAS